MATDIFTGKIWVCKKDGKHYGRLGKRLIIKCPVCRDGTTVKITKKRQPHPCGSHEEAVSQALIRR